MNTGWICPKCGRVYAPCMMECTHCNDSAIIASNVFEYIDPEKKKDDEDETIISG